LSSKMKLQRRQWRPCQS